MFPPTPPATPPVDVSANANSNSHQTSSFQKCPESLLGQVLNDRFHLVEVLGVGAYGVVYKARDVFTGEKYAVKALNNIGLDKRQREFQIREIKLHHQASQHRNVVSLYTVIETHGITFVILEYCPEGDLFLNITEKGRYVGNDAVAKSIFLQILDAVEYCHSIGIYHRDLKPENILVTDSGKTVKLADFGLATSARATCDYGCGSTFYMSPECQQTRPQAFSNYYSAPNDVWSLGVILVNLSCGRNPWKRACFEDSTFQAYFRDRNFLTSILPISSELNAILNRVFEIDPSKRISLSELRQAVTHCHRLTTNSQSSRQPSASNVSIPSSILSNNNNCAPVFSSSTASSNSTSASSASSTSQCYVQDFSGAQAYTLHEQQQQQQNDQQHQQMQHPPMNSYHLYSESVANPMDYYQLSPVYYQNQQCPTPVRAVNAYEQLSDSPYVVCASHDDTVSSPVTTNSVYHSGVVSPVSSVSPMASAPASPSIISYSTNQDNMHDQKNVAHVSTMAAPQPAVAPQYVYTTPSQAPGWYWHQKFHHMAQYIQPLFQQQHSVITRMTQVC